MFRVILFFLLGGFLLAFEPPASAQNQSIADSLKRILAGRKVVDSLYLEQLKQLSNNETEPQLMREYAQRLVELAGKDSIYSYMQSGYLQIGNAERLLGNLEEAMEAFFLSLEIAERTDDQESIGGLYNSIADIYSVNNNPGNAILYYDRAIAILRKTSDSLSLGGVLYNKGDEYLKLEKYDTALLYFKEAGELFRRVNYPLGIAYNLGNIGAAHQGLGQFELAEQNLIEAIRLLEEFEDYYAISSFLINLAEIHQDRGDFNMAIFHAERSLELASDYGLKQEISNANRLLSDLYEQSGNPARALAHFKEFIAYRDSVNNLETIQKMADMRTDYEVSRKQIEVDLLNEQRHTQQVIAIATGVALFLIALLAFGLFRRNRYIHRTNRIIEQERERSDNLLLNILPEETAQELKEKGSVQAKSFSSVTVLFADFKSFTSQAKRLSPEELVESVDFYFSEFDAIMEKYGLEKIKTVGDAYMCAGGLPDPTPDHANRMVSAALDMQAFVKKAKQLKREHQVRFEVRIGVNTGPIVAGVVGTKKFAYDIWGDTVNIASRMESSAAPGKVNISENTYQLVRDQFDCTYRGTLRVKNRGKMDMYYVEGTKAR